MKWLSVKVTEVAGTTGANDTGVERQAILRNCEVGQSLVLVHNPKAKADKAVKVICRDGRQVGWLDSEVAEEVAPLLDIDSELFVEIFALTATGKGEGGQLRCTIQIAIPDALADNLVATKKAKPKEVPPAVEDTSQVTAKPTRKRFPGVLWLLPLFLGVVGGIIAALISALKYQASWWELLVVGIIMTFLFGVFVLPLIGFGFNPFTFGLW